METVEDQQKFLVPMNKVSEKIYYNIRMLLDNFGISTEPRAWRVSKVNRVNMNGIQIVTLAQDQFDSTHDYIEHEDPKDLNSSVIGMWADYFVGETTPIDSDKEKLPTIRPVMSYKGRQDSTMKIGGNVRHFVVQYYDIDDNEVDYRDGEWSLLIDDEPYEGSLIFIEATSDNGHVKVRLAKKDDENRLELNKLIGKKCTVKFLSIDGIETHIDMNIAGL